MTEKPSLTKLLKASAGITDQGALVYKFILIVGSLTVGEVCEYTGLSYESASGALDELVEKKLIRKLTQVINRYVAVAPYRAFAELLVEFQRVMKELQEKATKAIEAALTEISKTNETWKATAINHKEELVAQARQDVRILREDAATARSTLVDKLKKETEAKSSSLIEMLRRHLEEHSTEISNVEKDITLKVDNSVAKFTEVAARLKEQITQTITSHLTEFEEKITLFHSAVESNLSSFQSDFSSSVESFQGQTSAFFDDTSAKLTELADLVRNKTFELIKMTNKSFDQISNQLQVAVTKNVESTTSAVSTSNRDLEINLAAVSRTHAEKLIEAITNYQARTREEITGWCSATKEALGTRLNSIKEEIERSSENLVLKIDSTKDSISEAMKSHLSSTETASSDLGSNLGALTDSLKRELDSKTGSPMKELRESCESVAKECVLLGSSLVELSKRNIPLASKAITDFTADVNATLSKMSKSHVTNTKSFASEIKEKALRVIEGLAAAQPKLAPAESGKKSDEPQIKPVALRKDLAKQLDAVTASYVEEIEKGIQLLDKQASSRLSAISGFEKELGKKWNSITEEISQVSELTEDIKSFPQRTEKIVSDLVEQYSKKGDTTIASAKRILNVHSTTLGDTTSSTIKKWSNAVSKTKTEILDLSRKRVEAMDAFFSSQISEIEKIADDRNKVLEDLASQRIGDVKVENSTSQTNVSKQIVSNTQAIIGSLEDVEGRLKNTLQTESSEFRNQMDIRTKENDELIAEFLNKAKETMTDLKAQFSALIDRGRESIRQVCENASSQLKETTSVQSKQLNEVMISATKSFNGIVDSASESFTAEGQSIKGEIGMALTQHLKNYSESVKGANSEIADTFAEHLLDCTKLMEDFGQKLDNLLATHLDKFEKTANGLTEKLTKCIDQDEAAINSTSREMLREYTDNTTKTSKEAGSTENLMRTAWAEITDTQQINADKTWHCVTKQAVLQHMKDMLKRTKSTVTIVVPALQEAPIKEVKEISKAIRVNIIAGIDETQDKKVLRELFAQGNVRLWSLTEKDYISCTRDAEEVLIAPVARKDIDCVATVSIEENYVKLYHRFIGPMWMASSREVKERALG